MKQGRLTGRRRRTWLVVMMAAPALLVAKGAHGVELDKPRRGHLDRPTKTVAIEIRLGPYRPAIDEEPGLDARPFAEAFGTRPRAFVGAEVDWLAFRIPHVGTVGPGLGAGRVSMSGRERTRTGRPTGEEFTLEIHPIYLAAVLRADALWQERHFPLVPYGKIGFGMARWRVSDDAGTRAERGTSAKGTTLGTHLALGLAFALDAIDHGASRNLHQSIGLAGTYLFAEYYWLTLDGLGKEGALRAGTSTWAAGLAVEF
jgi:hypothetical protein